METPEPVESWEKEFEEWNVRAPIKRTDIEEIDTKMINFAIFQIKRDFKEEVKALFRKLLASQKQKQIEEFVSMLEARKYIEVSLNARDLQWKQNWNRKIDDIITKLRA